MRPETWRSRSSEAEMDSTSVFARANPVCLPSTIVSTAPTCALTCIETFIANNYDNITCQQASSLTFLCASLTDSGLTIGEGGLQCVVSNCQSTNNLNIYNVCNNVPGAQPKLASTITATVNPAATQQSQAVGSQTQNVPVTTPAVQTTASIAMDTGLPPTMTSMAFTTANVPFPAAPTTTATAAASASAPGQVAGIAVGSVAGAVSLLGVIFFFCLRKRRQQRDQWDARRAAAKDSPYSSLMVTREPSPVPIRGMTVTAPNLPQPMSSSMPRGLTTGMGTGDNRSSFGPGVIAAMAPFMGQRDSHHPPTGDQNRRSFWRKSIRPEDIGVAVSPKDGVGFFRRSNASNNRRTRSMMPIPESSVLPAAMSPVDSENSQSEADDDRDNIPQSTDEPQTYTQATPTPTNQRSLATPVSTSELLRTDRNLDPEAQAETGSSLRGSILSSARASIVNMGALLAKKVSLKREHAPPRPLILGSPNANKKLMQQVNRYPLTPKYDNGNFVASETTSPPNRLQSPAKLTRLPRKPTFSSFIAGKLLPASTLKSPPPAKLGPSGKQPLPPVPTAQTSDLFLRPDSTSDVTDVGDFSSPDEGTRQNSSGRSPGMLPAPLAIKKVRSRESSRNINTPQYPTAPSSANMSLQADRYNSPRPSASRSRAAGLNSPEYVQDYTNRPLPSIASTYNFEPIRAAAASPGPRSAPSDEGSHSVGSPADMSPRGKPGFPSAKPGFPSMAPSLSSIYNSYKNTASNIPSTTTSTMFMPPPPLPLGEYSNINRSNRGVSEMISPDSANPGRNSLTPKWLVTPNRTKTGDLFLMVGDM